MRPLPIPVCPGPLERRRRPAGRGTGGVPSARREARCRLAHRLCNCRDYTCRKKIYALLAKRMPLEEIAEKLNAEKVPTIHGTNRWTATSVRKAFVS